MCESVLQYRDTTLEHLYRHGFVPNYYVWLYHGERSSPLVYYKLVEPSTRRNYGLGSQSRGVLHLPDHSGHASSQGSISCHPKRDLRDKKRERQVEKQAAERERQAEEQEAARVAAKERRWKRETEQLIEAEVITKWGLLVQQFAWMIEEELVQLKIMQHVISEEVKKVEGRQRAKRKREEKEREGPMSRRVEVEQHQRVKIWRENNKRDELIVRRMVEEVRMKVVYSDDDVDPPQLSPP